MGISFLLKAIPNTHIYNEKPGLEPGFYLILKFYLRPFFFDSEWINLKCEILSVFMKIIKDPPVLQWGKYTFTFIR